MRRLLALAVMAAAATGTNPAVAAEDYEYVDRNQRREQAQEERLEEKQERREERQEPRTERFRERDTNGDGYISPEEFEAGASTRFEDMDADNDGRLSIDEMGRAYYKSKDKMRGMRPKAAGRGR